MAFKKVESGKRSYVQYKTCVKGQVLAEGHYRGRGMSSIASYGHNHQIEDLDGNVQILNKSGMLDKRLADKVKEGDYIRVTFDGAVTIAKGDFAGKLSNTFVIEIDEDRRDDNSNSYDPLNSHIPSMQPGGVDEEEDLVADVLPVAAVQAPVAVAPAAAPLEGRKISAQELLNKHRRQA